MDHRFSIDRLYRIENGLPAFVILTRESGGAIRFIHDRIPPALCFLHSPAVPHPEDGIHADIKNAGHQHDNGEHRTVRGKDQYRINND